MALAGIPDRYHISCRVRNSDSGLDAETDFVIEAPTAMAALVIFVCGESMKDKAWLRCSANAWKSLMTKRGDVTDQSGRSELEIMGWDSVEDGGDSADAGFHNDWETNHLEHDAEAYTAELFGTSCLSEFEFEIRVRPASEVSKQETSTLLLVTVSNIDQTFHGVFPTGTTRQAAAEAALAKLIADHRFFDDNQICTDIPPESSCHMNGTPYGFLHLDSQMPEEAVHDENTYWIQVQEYTEGSMIAS
jgi:hypothetical protein